MTAKPEAEAGSGAAATITVIVVYSPGPRQVLERRLMLPAGSSAAQALSAFAALEAAAFPDFDLAHQAHHAQHAVGVWGKKAFAGQALRDQDRVEIYRPLKVDPKAARRERFVKQGAKKAGLFAKRRDGAKPGY